MTAGGKALDKAWIAARIPHQGAMCLLDRVADWGPESIRCESDSHAAPDHPLREHGRLAAVCGIEYAAQAMAVHGALLHATDARPRKGYLASVRKVAVLAAELDAFAGTLTIEATRVSGDANNVLYDFTVRAGAHLLLTGRAAVILDATGI